MDGSDLIKFLWSPALCFIFHLQRKEERSVRYWQCLLSIKTDTMTNPSGLGQLINDISWYVRGEWDMKICSEGSLACVLRRVMTFCREAANNISLQTRLTKYHTQKFNNQSGGILEIYFLMIHPAQPASQPATDQMSIILRQSWLSVWSEPCITLGVLPQISHPWHW